MRKNTMVVFNHDYQIEHLVEEWPENYKVVRVCSSPSNNRDIERRVDFTFGLMESQKFGARLSYKLSFECFNNVDRVVFFGLQDTVSWLFAKKAHRLGIQIEVVPDNIEFFLRGEIGFILGESQFTDFLRAFSYRVFVDYCQANVRFWNGRPIYSLSSLGAKVLEEMSFYNKALAPPRSENVVVDQSLPWAFVSQPYYLDYDIDLDEWLSNLLGAFNSLGLDPNQGEVVLHQRDSDEYVSLIKSMGFRVADVNRLPKKIVGIFSTYLFQLALSGYEVFSCLSFVSKALPRSYVDYTNFIGKTLVINLSAESTWCLEARNLSRLSDCIVKRKLDCAL